MNQCVKELCVTDPERYKQRIEGGKEQLVRECYMWILEDRDLQDWRDNNNSRLLWIKGDPGKGKTMLMIALINELSTLLEQSYGSGVLAYFFCQNTDPRLNKAAS